MAITQATGTQIKDGSIGVVDLSATGTPSATTFLRGDNVWATPAGGSVNVLTNNVTFSFPVLVEDESVLLTVLSVLITNSNFKSFSFLPLTSIDHENLDDFQWDNLGFNIENIIDNVSFDLRATSANQSWGNYNIKYIITY